MPPAPPARAGATGPDGPPPRDVAGLLRVLQADPSPRLTWYGPDAARVELTGRVLVTWVAKTTHQLGEDADVEPGALVRLDLGGDWRAPVFWLAASYLGVRPLEASHGSPPRPPDVLVVQEGGAAAAPPTVTVVVPRSPLPGPVADLPAGAVDHGEVNLYPDALPAPGPPVPLPTGGRTGRVLLDAATAAADVVACWAVGGSVVLHAGLDADQLGAVAAQERATAP
jgi:hypothetical protein